MFPVLPLSVLGLSMNYDYVTFKYLKIHQYRITADKESLSTTKSCQYIALIKNLFHIVR
jgi:hypothetical protein